MVQVLLLAAVLGAARPPAKAQTPANLVEKAHKKMKSLDYEAALPLLQQALGSPKLVGVERAAALIDTAITHINLGNPKDANEYFGMALDTDPEVELPKGSSPKIQAAFVEVQKGREAPPPPPPPVTPADPAPVETEPVEAKAVETAPADPPPAEPAPATDVRTLEAKPEEGVEAISGEPVAGEVAASPTSGRKIAAYTLIGVGLAAAGGGAGCLGYSWSQKADFDSGKLSPAEVDTAKTLSSAGVATMAVGGVALVAGVVLALLPENKSDAQVFVVPTRDGGAAVLSFVFP